jgi:peroxiredoxin Q/BCP
MTEGAPGVVIGEQAPTFTLKTEQGSDLSLADLRGKRVVLYFYPKADTPGCTAEACAFRDLRGEFAAKNAEIVGVSLDNPEDQRKFAEKYSLPFRLLADEQADVSKRYGVYVRKERDGREFWGIDRTTFLIDRDGVVRKIYPKVTVEGHADQILADLEQVE